MTCIRLRNIIICDGGPIHTLIDARGKRWTFENHPYCGPMIVSPKTHEPAREPGPKSAFWPAYEKWLRRKP